MPLDADHAVAECTSDASAAVQARSWRATHIESDAHCPQQTWQPATARNHGTNSISPIPSRTRTNKGCRPGDGTRERAPLDSHGAGAGDDRPAAVSAVRDVVWGRTAPGGAGRAGEGAGLARPACRPWAALPLPAPLRNSNRLIDTVPRARGAPRRPRGPMCALPLCRPRQCALCTRRGHGGTAPRRRASGLVQHCTTDAVVPRRRSTFERRGVGPATGSTCGLSDRRPLLIDQCSVPESDQVSPIHAMPGNEI